MDPTIVASSALIVIAAALLFLLVLIKIYILFHSARRKTIRRWFYFKQQEIVEATSPRIRGLRKTQNALTVIFFVLAAIAGFLLILFRK